MDIISQLQEQLNTIASLAYNTFGTLQRDAPPVQLSPNYPDPPSSANTGEDAASLAEQPKILSTELVKAAKQFEELLYEARQNGLHEGTPTHKHSAFDILVAALPLSEGGGEAQLKRIAELQAENDIIGQELQKQLEAAVLPPFTTLLSVAEKELRQVQDLFRQATDNCLNLKKPD